MTEAIQSDKTTEETESDREKCPHCVDGRETYHYFKGAYKFDVDRAREIVLDGREPVELEPDDVEYSVDLSWICEQHLAHVNTKYPGIIAHVWGPGEDGNWLHGHLLIDGHHRAARCLQLGIPFYVHILTEDESQEILLTGPKNVR